MTAEDMSDALDDLAADCAAFDAWAESLPAHVTYPAEWVPCG